MTGDGKYRTGPVFGRRAILRGAAKSTAGLAVAMLVGCGSNHSRSDATSGTGGVAGSTSPGIAPSPTASNEGILSIGNFQFEAQDWKEATSDSGKRSREGWRYATITGKLRNTGRNVSSLIDGHFRAVNGLIEYRTAGPDREAGTAASFSLSANGNKYDLAFFGGNVPMPPRFSEKVWFEGWIPETQTTYALTSTIANLAQATSQVSRITKGDTARNSPVVSPGTKISDLGSSLVIPNLCTITFPNNIYSKPGSTDALSKKTSVDWYAELQLKNTSGQDIDSSLPLLELFLTSGDTVTDARSNDGGPQEHFSVAPGLTKTLNRRLQARSGNGDGNDEGLREQLRGGVAVVVAKDAWIAWQLP